MEGNDIVIMIGSMVATFVLGMVGMMFFGGRTTLNYLIVKASRGRKVLVFGKTPFGWRSFVGKKENNTVKWKYDGTVLTTTIVGEGVDGSNDVTRYMRLDTIFADADNPASAIRLRGGGLYPDDFDAQTFNHILTRALTRPTADGDEKLQKMLVIAIILLILVVFGVLAIYTKLSGFASSTGVVI